VIERELAVLRLLSSELSQREISGALYSQRADAVTRELELL
jgi:hypothetical protein